MARTSKWEDIFSGNQRYGKWVIDDPCVIFRDGRGQSKVWARCDCGKHRQVFCHYLANGRSKSCGCAVSAKGETHPAFKGVGDVSKTAYRGIVRSLTSSSPVVGTTATTMSVTATPSVHVINLSPQLLNDSLAAQNYSCSVTSQPLTTANGTVTCLNSSEGYVSGNIQWVHKDIKAMQGNMNMETFVEMCRKVVDAADKLIVPSPKSDNPVVNAAQQIADKYNGKIPR